MLIFTRICSDLAIWFPYVKEPVGFFSELKLVIKDKSSPLHELEIYLLCECLLGRWENCSQAMGMYLFHLPCSLTPDCVLAAAMCIHLWVPECWCHNPCLSGRCFYSSCLTRQIKALRGWTRRSSRRGEAAGAVRGCEQQVALLHLVPARSPGPSGARSRTPGDLSSPRRDGQQHPLHITGCLAARSRPHGRLWSFAEFSAEKRR